MYITINSNAYPIRKLSKTNSSISYIGAEVPIEAEINGTITLCRNDDFVMREDSVSDYLRYVNNGDSLILTNTPLPTNDTMPIPTPEPTAQDDTEALLIDHEYRLTLLELGIFE